MKIDYNLIIDKINKLRIPKLSAKEKFRDRYTVKDARSGELYLSQKRYYCDENKKRKLYNHLKLNGFKDSIFINDHFRYYKIYRVRGKGIFEFSIINFGFRDEKFEIQIKRNTIVLELLNQQFNLHDKSERFAASMYFTFDYDMLVKIQTLLKKKPSGFYSIFTD